MIERFFYIKKGLQQVQRPLYRICPGFSWIWKDFSISSTKIKISHDCILVNSPAFSGRLTHFALITRTISQRHLSHALLTHSESPNYFMKVNLEMLGFSLLRLLSSTFTFLASNVALYKYYSKDQCFSKKRSPGENKFNLEKNREEIQ